MSVVSLYEDKLSKLEHVAAVTRDYHVNPMLGIFISIARLFVFCL